MGAIYKRVGRSAAAGWIGEWLAACKAASHRRWLEGGLCPAGALRAPPPRIF